MTKIVFIALLVGAIFVLLTGANWLLPDAWTEGVRNSIADLSERVPSATGIASHIYQTLSREVTTSSSASSTSALPFPEIVAQLGKSLDAIKKEILPSSFQAPTSGVVALPTSGKAGVLSRSEVIRLTNAERVKKGLAPLVVNSVLDTASEMKAKDMFERQYFAHVSPVGVAVGDVAKKVGYGYILVGENIALGIFKNDNDLVQAWMDSPGHRDNILNVRYREIGVAVMEGVYEGRKQLIGVQTFAVPLAACPQPDAGLGAEIESNQVALNDLEIRANALRAEIYSAQPKYGTAYNAKIDEYNALVPQVNNLIEKVKNLIAKYNAQIKVLNDCIEKG